MFVGESSNLLFGGMGNLLAKAWMLDEFMDCYIFTKPENVLVGPKPIPYLFERYRMLMAKKYPQIPVSNQVPMSRPVDFYFKT